MTSPIPCSHESSIAIANYQFIWMVQPSANLSFPNWRDRHCSNVSDSHAAAIVSCPASFVLQLHVNFSTQSLKAVNLFGELKQQIQSCFSFHNLIIVALSAPQLLSWCVTRRGNLWAPSPQGSFRVDDARASDIQLYLLDRVIYSLISLRVADKLWVQSRHKIWLAVSLSFLCCVDLDVFFLHNSCRRLAVFSFLVHSNFLILPCHAPS